MLLSDNTAGLTERRYAAELLGWYGSDEGRLLLTRLMRTRSALPQALRESVARAFSRLAQPDQRELLHQASKHEPDPAERARLAAHASRLASLAGCAGRDDQATCLAAVLAHGSWREQERAALELARRRDLPNPELPLDLLRRAPQPLRRAALLLLDHAKMPARQRLRGARALRELADRRDNTTALSDRLRSETLCLAARLETRFNTP